MYEFQRMAKRLIVSINCMSDWEAPPRHGIKCDTPDMYSHITLPTIEAYADKVNADLEIIKEDHRKFDYPSPHFLKFNCFQYFLDHQYDQMLYLDMDIIIKKNAPDIFSQYPRGLCLANDFAGDFPNNEYKIWIGKIFNAKVGKLDYFNSGVILSDRPSMERYLRKYPKKLERLSYLGGFGEQHLINYLTLRVPITVLDSKFNNAPEQQPFFVHYIGKRKSDIYIGSKGITS